MLKLSPRLKMTADLVRPGVYVADIGTDHAYLPAYLLLTGKTSRAISADLREMPLQNARQTITQYELSDNISLVLSNGLAQIDPAVQDIVIAGMGGTLIAEILSKADWIKAPDKQLILQPMSHAEDVRRFLTRSGFAITQEDVTEDAGKLYVAMQAVYTGKLRQELAPSYAYMGELPRCNKDVAVLYLQRQASRLKKRADALCKIHTHESKADELYTIIADIERCL